MSAYVCLNNCRGQRGHALTEFVVLSVALVPLFLLMPILAKYQDISHAAQAASRYVTFDAMNNDVEGNVWKPEAQLADEVRRRFFSNSEAAIKTGDVAGDFKANQNLFWRDPANKPLIGNFQRDVQVEFGFAGGASHAEGFESASDGQPFLLRNELALQTRGIYTAGVSVQIADLPAGLKFLEPFDQIKLGMVRRSSVLLSSWQAKDPKSVDQRILNSDVVFPESALVPVGQLVEAHVALMDAPAIENSSGGKNDLEKDNGMKIGFLSFWTDMVPSDRLK